MMNTEESVRNEIIEEHDCPSMQCSHFEKYEEAGDWRELERKQKLKKVAKTQKAALKQQTAKEAEYFEELTVLFPSYADGSRFPAFLKSVRFFFPHHQIVLHHVLYFRKTLLLHFCFAPHCSILPHFLSRLDQ